MTFSWQMIGGFGHLRHFRLGLPIRLPVLFTFTARFLSTEQFVFLQNFKNRYGDGHISISEVYSEVQNPHIQTKIA